MLLLQIIEYVSASPSVNLRQIAGKFKLSTGTLSRLLPKLGFQYVVDKWVRTGVERPEVSDEQLRAFKEANPSAKVKEIAEHFTISRIVIAQRLRKLGFVIPKWPIKKKKSAVKASESNIAESLPVSAESQNVNNAPVSSIEDGQASKKGRPTKPKAAAVQQQLQLQPQSQPQSQPLQQQQQIQHQQIGEMQLIPANAIQHLTTGSDVGDVHHGQNAIQVKINFVNSTDQPTISILEAPQQQQQQQLHHQQQQQDQRNLQHLTISGINVEQLLSMQQLQQHHQNQQHQQQLNNSGQQQQHHQQSQLQPPTSQQQQIPQIQNTVQNSVPQQQQQVHLQVADYNSLMNLSSAPSNSGSSIQVQNSTLPAVLRRKTNVLLQQQQQQLQNSIKLQQQQQPSQQMQVHPLLNSEVRDLRMMAPSTTTTTTMHLPPPSQSPGMAENLSINSGQQQHLSTSSSTNPQQNVIVTTNGYQTHHLHQHHLQQSTSTSLPSMSSSGSISSISRSPLHQQQSYSSGVTLQSLVHPSEREPPVVVLQRISQQQGQQGNAGSPQGQLVHGQQQQQSDPLQHFDPYNTPPLDSLQVQNILHPYY